MTGVEAARLGWATRAFPAEELESKTVEMAQRMAKIPADLLQNNKRTVHRAMDVMGMRAAIRYGSELTALGLHQRSSKEFLKAMAEGKLSDSLDKQNKPFNDYGRSEGE
jgi:enoyl-CoA hydratase